MKPTKVKELQEQEEANKDIYLLQKLVIYTKLANYDNIRSRLLGILNTDDKKRVFEVTNGENSVRDIQTETGVHKDTVSSWWNDWQKEGIVQESEKRRGRRCKVLSLLDFGIEVPNSPKKVQLK
jgi:DNA-binding MarR family transcriptional regulator